MMSPYTKMKTPDAIIAYHGLRGAIVTVDCMTSDARWELIERVTEAARKYPENTPAQYHMNRVLEHFALYVSSVELEECAAACRMLDNTKDEEV